MYHYPQSGNFLPLTSVFFTIFPFRSFVVSGGSAVYVAAYSVFYFVTKLEIDEFVPTLLYFSYTVRLHSQKTTGMHKFFSSGDHGRDLLAVDGHHWILRCLHVHPQDLWGGQDRLSVLH